MNNKSVFRLGLITSAIVYLSGCAGMLAVGEQESQCGAYEAMEGTSCMSVRDLYKASEGGGVNGKDGIAQTGQKGANGKPASGGRPKDGRIYDSKGLPIEDFRDVERKELEALRAEKASFGAPVIYGNGIDMDPTPWMEKPTPIRSQPKVQRIWIAPYEDFDGDLLAPGVVYTEIENRKWNIGEEMVTRPTALGPIQTFNVAGDQQGGAGQAIGNAAANLFGGGQTGLGGLPQAQGAESGIAGFGRPQAQAQGTRADGSFDLDFLKKQTPR